MGHLRAAHKTGAVPRRPKTANPRGLLSTRRGHGKKRRSNLTTMTSGARALGRWRSGRHRRGQGEREDKCGHISAR